MANYLTSDEWDLIVDALARTADAAEARSQAGLRAADDAKRHRLKKEERENRLLGVQHQKLADAMRALAEKIIATPVEEIAGTIPGATDDDPPWLTALRALNKARREHGL